MHMCQDGEGGGQRTGSMRDDFSDATRSYMTRYPHSALCARYAAVLSAEQQKQYLTQVIDDAAYYDTWQLYLEYLEHNTTLALEEIALDAVARVGLDPESVPLWLSVVSLCSTRAAKQRVLALGQSIPLFNAHLLHAASRVVASEAQGGGYEASEETQFTFNAVLTEERWPDRYADVDTPAVKIEVRQDWARLLTQMTQTQTSRSLSPSLRLQRLELAYRQMCAQLPDDDTCWYEYALFQLHGLGDFQAALDIIHKGICASQHSSFALTNLLSILTHVPDITMSPPSIAAEVSEGSQLLAQRETAENVKKEPSKERLRELRCIGKHAAMRGDSDWKLYSQWCTVEGAVTCDEKMAAKVLENGMICCSGAAKTALVTLGHEAIRFHLLHGQERESLTYAEQQAGLVMHTLDGGLQRSAWNALVQTERVLHFDATSAHNRRAAHFPRSRLRSFIEKYRVSNYLPCSPELNRWVEFSDDLTAQKRWEKEMMLKDIDVPVQHAISLRRTAHAEHPLHEPQLNSWVAFTPPANRFMEERKDEPDEVVGARELRGRWVYRVQVNAATTARLRREGRRLRQKPGAEKHTPKRSFSVLHKLTRMFNTVVLNGVQRRHLDRLSIDWLLQQLLSVEHGLE